MSYHQRLDRNNLSGVIIGLAACVLIIAAANLISTLIRSEYSDWNTSYVEVGQTLVIKSTCNQPEQTTTIQTAPPNKGKRVVAMGTVNGQEENLRVNYPILQGECKVALLGDVSYYGKQTTLEFWTPPGAQTQITGTPAP